MSETDRTLIAQDIPAKAAPTPKVSRWAYVLIVLGLLSLLDTIGIRNWGLPLVMVIVGIALVTKPYTWGGQLTTGLVVLALIGVVWWFFMQPVNHISSEPIRYGITADRAEIELNTSVGKLDINANNTGLLMDGNLEINSNERLERQDTLHGGVQFVRLAAITTGGGILLPNLRGKLDSSWRLGLSKNLPIELRVKTGVGSSNLDLTELKVVNLTVESGVGSMTVHLPVTGRIIARIEGGVGEIKIFIPHGMAARIQTSNGIGSVTVLGDYQHNRKGDAYSSSNFEIAINRVELEVNGGIGRIGIEQKEH
jgi:hypothetical protein